MSNRLLHTKVSKRKPLTHFPKKEDGHNGDMQIVSIEGKGTYLCLKDKGEWKISEKFNSKNKFDTHIFNEITTRKIKSSNNLMMSFGTVSGTIGGDSLAIPLTRFGDGTNAPVLTTLGSNNLYIQTGITDTPEIKLHSTGITHYFSGTDRQQFQWNSASSGAGRVLLYNQLGDALLECQVITNKDRYIRFTEVKEATNAVHALGTDATDDSFKLTYGTSLTQSPSDSTALLTIDTSGNTSIAGTVTAGGFTTTGTWTMDTSAGGTTGITNINITNAFTDDDVTIMSAGAIKEKIESYGYTAVTNHITNDAADIMAVSDFGANAALKIDADQPATAGAEDSKGLWIDYDRIVAGSGTAAHNDIGIDLDVNAASLGTSSVKGTDIDVVRATSGTHTAIGIDLDVDSADTNIGMQINTAGTHMKLVANADTDDYATFTLADTGDLTIATVGDGSTDSDLILDVDGDIELNADGGDIKLRDGLATYAHFAIGDLKLYYDASNYLRTSVASSGSTSLATIGGTAADADFTVDSGGDITLDSGTGIFIAKNAGTEFSAANSAYAGMILGYTRLEGDLSSISSFEIQDSMTVEDASHKVTFTTPPSENVEIEATFCMDVRSTDTRIDVGLSDSDTYNSVGGKFEYDNIGAFFSDDEIDDHVSTVKWVLGASELASVGSSNTFYIGFSTTGVTKTVYLQYGYRSSHGIADHPFVIKASALPATIYDGS